MILAPKGLVTQWVQKMETRFSEEFQLFIPSEFSYLENVGNIWKQFNQVVVPIDSRRGWSEAEIERFNRERFESMTNAAWDLVIIDEAHKVAGSTDTVARYKLGKGLAQASPYLLLLSATPHQGNTDSFHRLMTLSDQDAFPNESAIEGRRVAPYIIRTEKRKAIDIQGNPLFEPRNTQLVTIAWQEKDQRQLILYEEVTQYVRLGYNQALREKRFSIDDDFQADLKQTRERGRRPLPFVKRSLSGLGCRQFANMGWQN